MPKLQKHPLGYPVKFTNPTTGKKVVGQIIDEVWAKDPDEFSEIAPADNGWREGAFVTQLIEWPGRDRSVRFTYYLRKEGGGPESWYFGGQYSASIGLEQYRSLLEKLNNKNW